MPTAEEVATFLAYEFLKHGNYTASVGPVDLHDLAGAAAAAAEDEGVAIEYAQRAEPFGGLAVQSVGFEEGVRDAAKVHIYLTRGSSRLIKSLPADIDGVPVRIHKMGLITVRPEAASSAANRGHFFERHNRVCCGSSCAPTSENCTGTFGAIVRKGQAKQLYLLSNNHVFAGCNHVPQNQPILAPSSNDGNPTVRASGFCCEQEWRLCLDDSDHLPRRRVRGHKTCQWARGVNDGRACQSTGGRRTCARRKIAPISLVLVYRRG
jgi:hypothetical protein